MSVMSKNKYECPIYPGEFVPSIDLKKMKHRFHSTKYAKTNKPGANIVDSKDAIIIEISIPGVNRENFHVEVNENILSVFVIKNDKEIIDINNFKLHEFDCKRYERHLSLPKNADASFVSANYSQGILKLLISKSEIKSNSKRNKIVVY